MAAASPSTPTATATRDAESDADDDLELEDEEDPELEEVEEVELLVPFVEERVAGVPADMIAYAFSAIPVVEAVSARRLDPSSIDADKP